MTFTVPEFWAFLVPLLLLVWATRGAVRKLALLAGSYYFYASWDARFLLLLVGSTVVDFLVGRALRDELPLRTRKLLLTLSLTTNLGALAFFKYFGFFVDTAQLGLASLGVTVSAPTLHIVLPVGISFYTFQTLSYTIDVYRGQITERPSFLDFATYVAFFPQLVAGPIERASHFLPQLKEACSQSGSNHLMDGLGWRLIAWGCFKKVLADQYAGIVDEVFDDVAGAHPLGLWVGVYAFAIQIYLDFSGYTDTAIGLGRILGFEISPNFRAPYAATGPSDFWRRWHVSLSTWLRDYLYIPLGGNRRSEWFTGRNLLLTMVLGGLWHGAAWNFVLWGGYHGALLLLARLRPFSTLGRLNALPWLLLRRALWLQLVCLGWALFRAASLGDCVTLWTKLLNPFAWQLGTWVDAVAVSGDAAFLMLMGLLAGILLLVHQLLPVTPQDLLRKVGQAPPVPRYAFTAATFYVAAILANEDPPLFIYFQF